MGWMLDVMRRVMNDDPETLPPEVDFGGFIVRGLQVFVISLVYAIPLIIFSAPGPIMPMALEAVGMDADTMGIISIVVSVCCGGLSFIYGLFMALMLPAAHALFLREGSLGAAFKFGDVFKLVKSAIGPYALVLVGSLAASLISSLGMIACVVGLLITMPYALAIMGHLYGQAYKQAQVNLGLA